MKEKVFALLLDGQMGFGAAEIGKMSLEPEEHAQ